MKSRSTMKDVIISGFALFAIFFGAGNLIFPPMLGNITGDQWGPAVLGFLSTDPILPILAVIGTAFVGGHAHDFGKRISKGFAIFLAGVSILLIGPILSVPRTAAMTFEFTLKPYLPQDMITIGMVGFSLFFFALVFYFTINENRVIDIVGKFLTPALLIVMTILIVKAIMTPIGPIVNTGLDNVYSYGFVQGYQTMDGLGGALMCGIVLSDLIQKGYTERQEQKRMLIKVGLIAGILLAFVYGGLTYLGATTASSPASDSVLLLLTSSQQLLGTGGSLILGLTVALACLTTAVGLIATCANFFNTASDGKISYKLVIVLAIIVSTLMSLLSVSGIIALAVPILSTVYPMVAVLIIMTLFDRYIKYDITYVGPVFIAGVIGLVEALNSSLGWFEGLHQWILTTIPLAGEGFPWVVPAIIFLFLFLILGYLIKGKDTRILND